jgi:hypothetical protein
MTADAWVFHDEAKQKLWDGTLDLDTDTLVIKLYLSTSNCATTSVSDASTLTNEVATAYGYTQGGKTLASVTVADSSGTTTFDAADPTAWTASGGSITARFAVIVDETATPDEVIAHALLDNTPADVTATTGNTFTITFNASGIASYT